MNNKTATRPVMINLQKNAKPGQKIIKAGIVDRGAIDRAFQHQAREERLKAEQALALEKLKRSQAEAAAAAIKKQEQEKIAQQQKQQALQQKIAQQKQQAMQEKIAQQQKTKALQEKGMQERINQKKLAQEKALQDKIMQDKIAQNKLSQQKAAGLQAEKDRLLAQHDSFIATEVDRYKADITAAIIESRILSSIFTGDLQCTIRIRLLPDGSILAVNIERSSGNKAYDEMSENAIYKAAPFTMPEEHELYNKLRDIVVSFRNGDEGTDVL